ncbi:GNAT family N-acetyltransferase [Paenibacillus sp. MBLB4367]|uniref:GNAT family N-acetyltransferase n=1 Tax=Paenibacillus sp. MBLB4367 TaxID=3384767 RepID=UPI0039084165
MYSTRPAVHDDFAAVCTFPRNAEELFYMYPKGTFPLSADQLAGAAEGRHLLTVLVGANDEVAGYANVYGLEAGELCWLGNVIVSPAHRGNGGAELLIRSMIGHAQSVLGVKRLRLVCHSTNARALLFYTRIGFKPYEIARMEDHRGQTIAAIRMELQF